MELHFNSNTGTVDYSYQSGNTTRTYTINGITISYFQNDGFVHVLDVDKKLSKPDKWYYKNINENVLYDNHCSWVYVITIDDIVIKIGETGNPLGYRSAPWHLHPSPSTKGRISRYISGDGTDERIRYRLDHFLKAGHNISFWAKKCNTVINEELILGQNVLTESSTHKAQEMAYLDKFKSIVGSYPYLNKSRK